MNKLKEGTAYDPPWIGHTGNHKFTECCYTELEEISGRELKICSEQTPEMIHTIPCLNLP